MILATFDLQNSKEKIIDISLKYGYERFLMHLLKNRWKEYLPSGLKSMQKGNCPGQA